MGAMRLLLPVILCLGFAARAAPAEPAAGTLVVGGVERHYIYVLPASYDATMPIPVVFVFHGAGSNGASLEKSLGFTQQQGRRYFLAVYPDGLDKVWNGGRSQPTSLDSARSDDVGFISALIDALSGRYSIDPRRIYATGSSNGAMFCDTLALRLSERIAAIGPVNGNLSPSVINRYQPGHSVSVISFNGTADPFVPYNGDADPGHRLLSTPDTIAFWVRMDSCDPSPRVTNFPRAAPDDGTAVKCFDFRGGRENTEVAAYVISEGGHTWPGYHTDPTWAKTAGKTAMSVDATDAILDFFEKHPKP
jgi:polyhydroxybutyrate depolymerase